MAKRIHASRKARSSRARVDELIRKSRPYFELEKQTRLLELQNNRLIVINGQLGKHVIDLERELETYRAKEAAAAKGLTAEEYEAERQARIERELAGIPEDAGEVAA